MPHSTKAQNSPVAVNYDPFVDGPLVRVVPTTEPQREMWLSNQLGHEASLSYNESVTLHLTGPLDHDALQHALQDLIDRHSALHSNFGPDGETLCVFERRALDLNEIDLRSTPLAQYDGAVLERQRLAVETPFKLTHGPLFRTELIRCSASDHHLILTAHHIICDGWSWWVLVRELGALYAQHQGGALEALPAADDFADYALDQAEHAGDIDNADDERYWLSRFEGDVPVLDLPTDRARPAHRSFDSAREDVVFDADLVSAIQSLGAHRGVSLFAALLGSFATLLSRLANQSSVVIGIPTAGQALNGHERLVGHCVNTLPLRFEVDSSQAVGSALDQAQQTLLDGLDHQRYTFGTLLRKLRIERDPTHLPLVSVMFNIDQALEHEDNDFPGLQLGFSSNARSYENFELAINAVQERGTLRVECQYNRDLFEGATIRRWMGYWRTLLQGMVAADTSECIGHVPLLDSSERRRVLETFNDTAVPYPSDVCIHELIEAQVERTPEAIAVSHDNASLSYFELNARANRLAHYLRQRGVGPDSLVAVCAERGLDMVIGLLAILKAGGAYVPMDPDYPNERLRGMLADCSPTVVLVQQACAERLAGLSTTIGQCILDPSDPEWGTAAATNPPRIGTELGDSRLAYVIYTSGSTGTPKGAMNEHRGVINRLLWMQDMFALGAADAVLQKTPFSFDVSVWELFLPLITGARLVMARAGAHKDPAYIADILLSEKITTVHFVPSMLAAFLEYDNTRFSTSLHRVVCSGEALPATLASDFLRELPSVSLYNMYGPTEAAVDVTTWHCTSENVESGIPIGRPVANTQIYILDASGEPVPVGVTGEIFIGGTQVGRGYLGRDALTRERFLDDPFRPDPSTRMYKTGDLARWRADGNIEYLGRNDFQVKLRGFRIELGEIESRLASHPDVARSVVLAREDRPGDMRLVAYVVARQGAHIDNDAITAYLGETLPEYMVPNLVFQLDSLPLSANGKIDRKKLPAPQNLSHSGGQAGTAPHGTLERQVCDTMASVLGMDQLGVDEDFFASGGHSLLAARLVARLSRELDIGVPLRSVFDAPTATRLSSVIRELEPGRQQSQPWKRIPRRRDRAVAPLSLMQQRVWYLEQLHPGGVVFNSPSAHRLLGAMDEQAFERAFHATVQRQSALRTSIQPDDKFAVQRIHAEVPDSLLPVEDLSGLASGDEREEELRRQIEVLTAEPFDLATAPLFRTRLFRLGAEEHVFYFMPHHIIWDGWSFDLLYEDMSKAYSALLDGKAPEQESLPVEYGDFSAWHSEWMRGAELEQQMVYWRECLKGRLEPLALPLDRPRPARMSGAGATEWLQIPASKVAALRKLGSHTGTTLFMLLLTVYYILLHRLSSQRDLIVNTPVRARDMPELESVMGFFVNALPLRVTVNPDHSFEDLLSHVRSVVLDAFSCSDVPFEQLVIDLKPPRDESRPPISQAMFSFQDVRLRPRHWGTLEHQNIPVFQKGAADDIGVWFIELAEGLTGGVTYNTDILEAATVKRWTGYLHQILDQVLASPDCAVGDLELMSADERKQLLESSRGPKLDYDRTQAVPALIEAQMRQTPQRIAAACGDAQLSYADLEQASRALAMALGRRGIGRGDLVGLYVPRSLDMLVALLGVLRSGAAYVPLDPDFPEQRLAFMAEHAHLQHILVAGSAQVPSRVASGRNLLQVTELVTEKCPPSGLPEVGGEDLAYVLYTSGSTGQPKGVCVVHRNLVNFLGSMKSEPGFGSDEVLCAVTTLSFDIAGLEMYLPLVAGGRLVIANESQHHDPQKLCELLERSECNVLQTTPSLLGLLQRAGLERILGRVRLFIGGEPLPQAVADGLAGRCGELWNLYGPTETTIWSTCTRIGHRQKEVSLGRPITNTAIYVLDSRGCLVPPGVSGEIHIAGAGVADGYLHAPELTAERFIADPFTGGNSRMYRTGDIGSWKNGELYFHGRADDQLKVRGYRIELGDIEAAALRDPDVRECVVLARDVGQHDVRLVLYVVPTAEDPSTESRLRDVLRAHLPGYMLPQHIEYLDALPRTPNGKIDRKSLAMPDLFQHALPRPPADMPTTSFPETPTEILLENVWRELIGVSAVGPSDNFFELGGHSLLAVEMVAQLERETGMRLDLIKVASGTARSLARELAASRGPVADRRWRTRLRKMLPAGLQRAVNRDE